MKSLEEIERKFGERSVNDGLDEICKELKFAYEDNKPKIRIINKPKIKIINR